MDQQVEKAARERERRRDKKQRRRDRDKENKPVSPFPLPSGMRVRIFPPRFEPITEPKKEVKEYLVRRYESKSDSDRFTITHGEGHVAIPNPRYVDEDSIPRYAAMRLVKCLTWEQQAEMQRRMEELDKVTICYLHPYQYVY
jgi:hypothetical protein